MMQEKEDMKAEPKQEQEEASTQQRSTSWVPEDQQGPPFPPPPLTSLAVVCEGKRFETSSEDDMVGFQMRAQSSFFQALLDPETNALKDSSGALVVNGMGLSVVEAVWEYLRRGVQPQASTLQEFAEWRSVCDYFSLSVPDLLADVRRGIEACALVTNRYLMVRCDSLRGLSPSCYIMDCSSMCGLKASPLGFDQVSTRGASQLQADRCERPLQVRLDPLNGALHVNFMREALWQYVGKHHCLANKEMVALKVRFPRLQKAHGAQPSEMSSESQSATSSTRPRWPASARTPPTFDSRPLPEREEVVELYIHARPQTWHGRDEVDACNADWPSFWCLARVYRRREPGHSAWSSWNATFEVLPGTLCVMEDDILVQVINQPRSLHKCCLRACGPDWEHEILVKLLAPAPFYFKKDPEDYGKGGHYYWGKGGMFSKGGKGIPANRKGFGSGPTLENGQKYYKKQAYSPQSEDGPLKIESRTMKQVWVVRRRNCRDSEPHLVVLLHSHDGRVAVAQLSGKTGCIPPLYGEGGIGGGRYGQTCAIWGAKAWHWGGPFQSGTLGQYRRSYDVPKCHEVMGIALQDEGKILVLHRPRSSGTPQLWTITQPKEDRYSEDGYSVSLSSFFRVHGKGYGWGHKGGKGGSRGPISGGSWSRDHWGTENERQILLPPDIVEGKCPVVDDWSKSMDCPLFVPLWMGGEGGSTFPEVEVLRLEGKAEYEARPPVSTRRDREPAHPTWCVTKRSHFRCREPWLPN